MLVLEMKKPKTRDVGVYIPITRGKYRDMLIWVDKEDSDDFKMYHWGLFIYSTSNGETCIVKGKRDDICKEISLSSLLRIKYAAAVPGIQAITMKDRFYSYRRNRIIINKNIINYRKKNLYPAGPSISYGSLKSITSEFEQNHPETWFNLKTWLQSQIAMS